MNNQQFSSRISFSLVKFFKKNWLYFLLFGLVFCYFAIFRYLLIPSGDDYFWWGPYGAYLVHHGFVGSIKIYGGSINGRYLGNSLEILTMHHLKLAILIFAGTWTLLIWCMWKLENQTWWALVLAIAFVFTLNEALLNNVLVWNAGFINYVPSMTLVLLYLVICKEGEKKTLNKYYAILTLIIGFAAGLFLEAIAMAQVVMGLIIVLFFTKQKRGYHFSYLLGAVAALLIIMSHPGYWMQCPYRKTNFNLFKMWYIYVIANHIWLISLNTILIILLLLAMTVIVSRKLSSSFLDKLFIILNNAFLVYYLVVGIYLRQVHSDGNYYYLLNPTFAQIDAIISLFLIGYTGYFICHYLSKQRKQVLLYYLCAGLYFSPLLFVAAPINSRGTFMPYIFMYLIMIDCVQTAFSSIKIQNFFLVIIALATFDMAGRYQMCLYENFNANLQRVLESGFIQGKGLLNKHVPHREFVWSKDRLDQQSPFYWRARLKK